MAVFGISGVEYIPAFRSRSPGLCRVDYRLHTNVSKEQAASIFNHEDYNHGK
jgi:hypothetical protein